MKSIILLFCASALMAYGGQNTERFEKSFKESNQKLSEAIERLGDNSGSDQLNQTEGKLDRTADLQSSVIGGTGRFVFGQVSSFRRDQFLLDTQTGRVWRIVETARGGTMLEAVEFGKTQIEGSLVIETRQSLPFRPDSSERSWLIPPPQPKPKPAPAKVAEGRSVPGFGIIAGLVVGVCAVTAIFMIAGS